MAYVPGTKLIKTGSYPQYNWQKGPSIINGWHPTVIKPHNRPQRPSGIMRPGNGPF